jgi:hypothetical protein
VVRTLHDEHLVHDELVVSHEGGDAQATCSLSGVRVISLMATVRPVAFSVAW